MFSYSFYVYVTIIVVSQAYAALALRNLSEVQYKFTPCGAKGRLGPSISQCIEWYSQRNSAISDKLFEFGYNGSIFNGAQGFRVPRSGIYNVTIGGAAGGRGLCSVQYGKGLVWKGQIYLHQAQRLLLLVGQAGLGPCDVTNLIQCKNLPTNLSSSESCLSEWLDWLLTRPDLSLSDVQIIYNFAGGGAGGGASMIRAEDSQTGKLQTWPLVVAGGGGGTASVDRYGFLDGLEIAIPPDASTNPSLQERFNLFINAKSTDRDYSISDLHNFTATRGYISFLADVLRNRPGAGGGYFPAASLYQEGLALNQTTEFALGGSDCLTYSADLNRHTLVESVHGGFGGGGGQCQSGGSGGGFTGGSVFSGDFGVAGNGGFSASISSGSNVVKQVDIGLSTELDGYIELVHTECQCSYKCVIMSELSKFHCICPEKFDLALNDFDCFQEWEYTSNNTEFIEEGGYIFYIINFESRVQIFSINSYVRLSTTYSEEFNANTRDIRNPFCKLAFLDSNGNIILESNIVRFEEGLINKLGVTNDVMLTNFLENSYDVYSVVLVSNYYCSFQDSLLLNISNANMYDDLMSYSTPNFTDIISLARKTESTIYNSENELPSSFNGDIISRVHNIQSIFIAVVSTVILALIATIVLISVITFIKCRQKRKKHSFQSVTKKSNTYTAIDKTGSLISNKLYVKHNVSRSESVSGSFCVINGDEIPHGDVVSSNMSTSVWEHSRHNLVYMKEIGEGHFGKVLLMKAIGMPHIHCDVPVAVKTLSSTDPAVVTKFFDEANLMKKLSHPNIVSILAVIFNDVDENNAPLMVLEYMPYGDLKSFLIKHRPGILFGEEEISRKQMLNFARDIAHAIKFLSEKHYIHRDVACRNCLVDSNLSVKLGDFGLTVRAKENGIYRGENSAVLPIKWTSPESLQLGIFSTSSDIWSFGVLLWEMATYGEDPLPDISTKDIQAQINNQILQHKRPPNCPDYYYDLMTRCHKFIPQDRISIDGIILNLTRNISQHENESECVIIFHH